MTRNYLGKLQAAVWALIIAVSFTACKKDNTQPEALKPQPKPLATLGLYQFASGANKRIFIPISQIGTQKVAYAGIFDTGSSGFTMDANGLLPASMITSNGIQVTGDSVTVNGITVTNRTATMAYGDLTGSTHEYGNLAYASIVIGNSAGSVTTKRIPIFLYYKIVDGDGKELPQHSADVFGVGPSKGYTFPEVVSPLDGLALPAGTTSGFKLAKLPAANFNSTGALISGLLTLGLVPDDLSQASSGFIMHPLNFSAAGGYSPNIQATITYGSTSVDAQVLFDTGNPSISVIENNKETRALGRLPANTDVTITTKKGFVYKYTTNSTGNLTQIQNPNVSGDFRTIMALDFFINNEMLTDYSNHVIGLKN
ncbi:hypothetical protein ABDD95_13085 [Mucilaginibacter sp. PAMB04274]|uniref:hypothetical protein n=1 Tax=Mucilaginibacter sp. PAMB04274 TaxID=3138568 RepID=UPI0031F63714